MSTTQSHFAIANESQNAQRFWNAVPWQLWVASALLAIEGENDDISGLGQTKAALKIATSLPAALKKYHMAKKVGHYGIFNGRRWRESIAPVVEDWIASHA